MSKSAKKDYKVKTNLKALSKVNDLLKEININNIPVIDFETNEKDTVANFVTMIMLEISKDDKRCNDFFKSITGLDEDFAEKEFEILFDICSNFFEKLPSAFLNTIRKSIIGLQKQRDMVIEKNHKATQKAIEKIVTKEAKALLTSTENG